MHKRFAYAVGVARRATTGIVAVAIACGISVAPARAWETVCNAAIKATMVDKVDSGTAFPGMRFRFKITESANVLDHILPNGTIGYGYVRYVSAASNHNKNGSLVLEMRELIYKNDVFQVMADPRESSVWAPATNIESRAEGYLPIPGLVRTITNEIRDGKNVTIGPGFAFRVIALGDPRKMSPCRKVGQ